MIKIGRLIRFKRLSTLWIVRLKNLKKLISRLIKYHRWSSIKMPNRLRIKYAPSHFTMINITPLMKKFYKFSTKI